MEEQPGGSLYLDDFKPGTAGQSLAVLGDVSKLVNEFAGGVFMTRAHWHAGTARARDPLKVIEKDAKRCGAIILGHDPEWSPQPWNDDRRLGVTLRVLLPTETAHYGDPGTALFMWLAAQLVAIAQEVEEGRLDEEDSKPEIARLCFETAGRILGTGSIPR